MPDFMVTKAITLPETNEPIAPREAIAALRNLNAKLSAAQPRSERIAVAAPKISVVSSDAGSGQKAK